MPFHWKLSEQHCSIYVELWHEFSDWALAVAFFVVLLGLRYWYPRCCQQWESRSPLRSRCSCFHLFYMALCSLFLIKMPSPRAIWDQGIVFLWTVLCKDCSVNKRETAFHYLLQVQQLHGIKQYLPLPRHRAAFALMIHGTEIVSLFSDTRKSHIE